MRWARILGDLGHQVDVATAYADDADVDLMLALHAWRSAASIARFKAQYPDRPLIVALTGTDLYHYLAADPEPTLRSLDLADCLIGLHDDVPAALPAALIAARSRSSFSPPWRGQRRWPVSEDAFEVLVVAHLRSVKDPLCAARAARRFQLGPGSGSCISAAPRIRSGPIGLGRRWRTTRATGGSGTCPAAWSGAG